MRFIGLDNVAAVRNVSDFVCSLVEAHKFQGCRGTIFLSKRVPYRSVNSILDPFRISFVC